MYGLPPPKTNSTSTTGRDSELVCSLHHLNLECSKYVVKTRENSYISYQSHLFSFFWQSSKTKLNRNLLSSLEFKFYDKLFLNWSSDQESVKVDIMIYIYLSCLNMSQLL